MPAAERLGAAATAGARARRAAAGGCRPRRRMPKEGSRQAEYSCRRSRREPPKEQCPEPKVSVPGTTVCAGESV